MNKYLFFTFFAVVCFFVSGCSTPATAVYNITAVDKVDFSKIDAMKKGIACENVLFNVWGLNGSQSIADAAKSAGISKVKLVDTDSAFYVLWTKRCVIVYGE